MKKIVYLCILFSCQAMRASSSCLIASTNFSLKQEYINLKKALEDEMYCNVYCAQWSSNEYPFDVDQLIDTENYTWGDNIDKAFTWNTELALKVAKLVQNRRSNKASTVQFLFSQWTNNIDLQVEMSFLNPHTSYKDPRIFVTLVTWFKKYPLDVDTILISSGATTIGNKLDIYLGRKEGLEFAHLVQTYRSQKNGVFDHLYTCGKSFRNFKALATWICLQPGMHAD